MKIDSKIKTFFVLIGFFLLALPVYAQQTVGLEVDWPESPTGEFSLGADANLADLTGYFYEWGITIGIIAFFGILIYAGVLYITSTGKPAKMNKAKGKMVTAFSGVMLLLGSWILLNTINPELTEIRTADFEEPMSRTHEFAEPPTDEENPCEFAFLTFTDPDGDEGTHTFIPGMTKEYDDVFPEEAKACAPERDRSEILDVKELTEMEDDEETVYLTIFNREGEMMDDADLDNVSNKQELEGLSQSEIEEFYRERYVEDREELTLSTNDDNIYDFWPELASQALYNSILHDPGGVGCEELMKRSDFTRPRCIEVEDTGNTVYEYRRKGFASLIEAFNYLQDEGPETNNIVSQDLRRDCPTAEEMGTDLGYERRRDGAGCSLAIYDGDTTGWPLINREVEHCRDLTSEVAADLEHFRGMVDNEIKCAELIRGEDPIDLEDMPTYYIFIKNEVSGFNHDDVEIRAQGVTDSAGPIEGLEDSNQSRMEVLEVPALSKIDVTVDIGTLSVGNTSINLEDPPGDCSENRHFRFGATGGVQLTCEDIYVDHEKDGRTYRVYEN